MLKHVMKFLRNSRKISQRQRTENADTDTWWSKSGEPVTGMKSDISQESFRSNPASEPEENDSVTYEITHVGCLLTSESAQGYENFNLPGIFESVWLDWTDLPSERELTVKNGNAAASGDGKYIEFVFSSGIAGEKSWAGVCTPVTEAKSDKIPNCVVGVLPTGVPAVTAMAALDAWFTKSIGFLDRVQSIKDCQSIYDELRAFSGDSRSIQISMPAQSLRSKSPSECSAIVVPDSSSISCTSTEQQVLVDEMLVRSYYCYSCFRSVNTTVSRDTIFVCGGLPNEHITNSMFSDTWTLDRRSEIISAGNIQVVDLNDLESSQSI